MKKSEKLTKPQIKKGGLAWYKLQVAGLKKKLKKATASKPATRRQAKPARKGKGKAKAPHRASRKPTTGKGKPRKQAAAPPPDPTKEKCFFVLAVEPGMDGRCKKKIIQEKKIKGLTGDVGRIISPTTPEIRVVPIAGELLSEGKEMEAVDARKAALKKAWELHYTSNPSAERGDAAAYDPPPDMTVRVFAAKGLEKGKQGNGWEWKVLTKGDGTKQVTSHVRKYPGYLIINMKLTDKTIGLFDKLRYSWGLLPFGSKPTALATEEKARILIEQTEARKKPEDKKPAKKRPIKLDYKVDDIVRVLDGAFIGSVGKCVRIVNHEEPVVIVEVEVMGKPLPLTLAHHRVEKVK